MKVAVVGAGNMGGGLAKLMSGSHEVFVGSRDAGRGKSAAEDMGLAGGGSYEEVVTDADVVFLTIPWTAVEETLPLLGDLDGKVLVDITNPYVDGKIRLHEGTSNAEIIASKAPGASVVKGWNTVFSQVVAGGPDFGGQAASVFLASDDDDAKEKVATLARDMGFDPIDSGPLKNARSLERLLTILGTLGHPFGWGNWALKVLSR
jgi:hypothetical protein